MYLHTGSSPAIPSKKKSSNFRKVNRNLPTPSSPAITVCSQASAARISNCCCRDGKGAQIATKRCAGLTTPSAPLRSLRDILLMAQPPLLCEEGNIARLLGKGYTIEWPDLDEQIGVASLLAGHRSGESRKSFERWLARKRPGSRSLPLKEVRRAGRK